MNEKRRMRIQWLSTFFCLVLLATCLTSAFAAGNWVAEHKSGCKLWDPEPVAGFHFSWTGGCKDGLLDGTGVLQWYDAAGKADDKYEGSYVKGYMQGKGIYTFAEGMRYEGDFVNNMRSGKAVITWPNGSRYEGDILDDVIHGNGTFTWANGRSYSGGYVNGLRQGKGVLVSSRDNRYEGEFFEGRRHGYGEMTYANGKVEKGQWKEGKFVGP